MSGINEEDLTKALDNLKSLSKSQTVSTKVESMVGESGSTQIFHTPSNSEPGAWAGSKPEAVPDNGPGVDKISENGTDLRMMKSILAKLAKGMDLNDDEKKMVEKAMKDDKDDKDKDDDKDDKKGGKPPFAFGKPSGDVAKSMADIANESPALRHGFEISDFLKSLTATIVASHASSEARIKAHVDARLETLRSEYADVSKSLTGVLADVGTVVGASARKLDAFEQGAARGPKSAVAQGAPLNKSMGAPQGGEPLSKSIVNDALYEMMQAKKVSPHECIKFDTTNELSRDLEAKVRQHLAKA